MTRIKIISNPYQKTIVFQHWNEVAGCWNPIDQANSPNSMLLREDLIKGFFRSGSKRLLILSLMTIGPMLARSRSSLKVPMMNTMSWYCSAPRIIIRKRSV